MTLTTLRLSSSGLKTTYRDHGSGEPIVLLHGVGMQSAAWGPQITALRERYRVIALDMPGHGSSDPLPTGSQLPDFVAWCQEAIQALELGAVNLAGHSMGALIAGGVAVSFPELVRRVALLNGVYCRDSVGSDAVIARSSEISAGKIDLKTPLKRWFGNSPSEKMAQQQVAEWLGAVNPTGYATAYSAFAQGDATYADQLTLITCPFLAMTGDGDPNSTPAMAVAMAEQMPHGMAVVIKGHKHMINLTNASEVNEHLFNWLEQTTAEETLP